MNNSDKCVNEEIEKQGFNIKFSQVCQKVKKKIYQYKPSTKLNSRKRKCKSDTAWSIKGTMTTRPSNW